MATEQKTFTLEERLKQLAQRRANPPEKIDNASLYAGSPMYFYCKSCSHLADVLPEEYAPPPYPKKLCKDCQELSDMGALP